VWDGGAYGYAGMLGLGSGGWGGFGLGDSAVLEVTALGLAEVTALEIAEVTALDLGEKVVLDLDLVKVTALASGQALAYGFAIPASPHVSEPLELLSLAEMYSDSLPSSEFEALETLAAEPDSATAPIPPVVVAHRTPRLHPSNYPDSPIRSAELAERLLS
jgi:hypothetical protein